MSTKQPDVIEKMLEDIVTTKFQEYVDANEELIRYKEKRYGEFKPLRID